MESVIIECNYAGGNIKVVAVEQNLIRVEQDLRDTTTWWFYWNFSVKSLQQQTIVVDFMNGEVVGPWGPAVSKDGVNWEWLGADSLRSRCSFEYTFHERNEKVYFSFSIPYQVHHFENFYAKLANNKLVKRKVLGISEQLQALPLLVVGNGCPNRHIVFTCRHHACESVPGYILEGIIDYLLGGTINSAVLAGFMFHFIPFVDVDGVENGDQGKNRAPVDHNRDYTDAPIYKSTAAIMKYVKALDLYAGIDFHCPYKWGKRDDYPFFVKKNPPIKAEIEVLGNYLKMVTHNRSDREKVVYDGGSDLEMGVAWNVSGNGKSSDYFAEQQAKLACTLEFPYFGTATSVTTARSCRQFGEDFAKALEHYLLNSIEAV